MSELDASRLRQVIAYDPASGVFTWRMRLSNRKRIGDTAGTVTKRGCIAICIDGQQHKAHRLAWLYMTGAWPVNHIDHRDGDPTNNKWINLRDVTHQTNIQNERHPRCSNKIGVLGVHQCSATGRYRASITVDGKCKQLGRYNTQEEAHQVYLKAKRQLHEGCTI